MELSKFQAEAQATDQVKGDSPDARLVPLLGLAGEVGSLLVEYKKQIRDGDAHRFFKEQVAEELGDILWYTANLSEKFGLNLDDIATKTLIKTRDRWPTGPTPSPIPLDASFPQKEQLPREFEAEFVVGDGKDGAPEVAVLVNGEKLGATLRDNSYIYDGYGFHDAFHLAYAAVLGWSPVVRELLGAKRKSDDMTDEVEDGGRAKVIEEGLAAYVFDYARRHDFLDGIKAVDFSVLKTIQRMTSDFEVSSRSLSHWEAAVIKGYEVWRRLKADRGGVVIGRFAQQDFYVKG